MKKRQYWILMAVLWICFLAVVIRILFILNPDTGNERNGLQEPITEESVYTEDDGLDEYPAEDHRKDDQTQGSQDGCLVEGTEPDRREERQEIEEKQAFEADDSSRQDEAASPSDAVKGPPRIAVASDLHYQSARTTDYGKAFERMVAQGDGKINAYLPQLLDALIEELIQQKPDAFLLTGDITINGEKINHLELAGKLKRLSEAGVPVLIIPGNHDINNYRGRLYFGDEETEAESVSLEEFTEIYQEFGWNQAISRDEASFSYIYPLRENLWLMLLDTAQYDPLNLVDGAVRPETCRWMEENLKRAKEKGIQVIVSGHHNLLQESRMFTTMCVLENSSQVTDLLEDYQVPLYISGHLHLQRIQKHRREPGEEGYGIYEIVSDAISIPPCQYGVLSWDEQGTITYETCRTDVSGWARRSGQTDENLLEFETYEKRYVRELIRDQILEQTAAVPEAAAEKMAGLYAELYADYCAGAAIDRRTAEASEGYRSWERYLPESKGFQEIRAMLKDSMKDNNFFIMP